MGTLNAFSIQSVTNKFSSGIIPLIADTIFFPSKCFWFKSFKVAGINAAGTAKMIYSTPAKASDILLYVFTLRGLMATSVR